MATDVILPALGMSQDTGKIVQWLKAEGEHVVKGEPLVEIETDKATVEIDAAAEGVLARVAARAGDDVPVGQVIARILSAHEVLPREGVQKEEQHVARTSSIVNGNGPASTGLPLQTYPQPSAPAIASRLVSTASTLAARVAAEHNVDLSQVKAAGKRIQKADVLAYLQQQDDGRDKSGPYNGAPTIMTSRLLMASPKARRLAKEQGKDLVTIKGSGPDGAVLAADVLAQEGPITQKSEISQSITHVGDVNIGAEHSRGTVNVARTDGVGDEELSTIWRIMAERTTQSWTGTPHFYLTREVNASQLMNWREQIVGTQSSAPAVKITYTDMLVKVVVVALRSHPRLNASWGVTKITLHPEIHVGLAVAIEDGLVVPVIHQADTLGLSEIAQQRVELVKKAQEGKLRPQDISGGTFTISNLGMYNVDAFNAIINQPQAAILAVGRIVERVVPVNGQPAVQPMMMLTLSCDHRVVDGARGARFLESIASFIEKPLRLLL